MADFDINQHLNMMRFGQQGSSDGSAGEAMTPDDLLRKGVDRTVQTITRTISGVLGIHLNSDIEGKGANSSLETQNVGSGLSLTNLGMIRAESGGGFLSMIWEMIKRHITREVNPSIEGIDGSGSGGGGGGDGGGGGGDGGSSAAMSGGGDMPSGMPSFAGGNEMPDVQVNYGGKMVSAEAMVGNLGNFSPPETPVARNEGRGAGTDMGM